MDEQEWDLFVRTVRVHLHGEPWSESLIWCPSQCTKVIPSFDVKTEIYLRWRHSDPWTCQLDVCYFASSSRFMPSFGSNDLFHWAGKRFCQDDDLNEIELHAIAIALFVVDKLFNPNTNLGRGI